MMASIGGAIQRILNSMWLMGDGKGHVHENAWIQKGGQVYHEEEEEDAHWQGKKREDTAETSRQQEKSLF